LSKKYTNKCLNYIETTDKWLDSVIPNNGNFKERHYYNKDGIRYKTNQKTVKHIYSMEEEKMALFIQKNLGGNVYMYPRIIDPNFIKTADYQYINHELRLNDNFDLKTTNSTSMNAINTRLRDSYRQSKSFIFHFVNKNMTNDMITKQIQKIYNDPARKYVNIIITVRDEEIRIFIRQKKEPLP